MALHQLNGALGCTQLFEVVLCKEKLVMIAELSSFVNSNMLKKKVSSSLCHLSEGFSETGRQTGEKKGGLDSSKLGALKVIPFLTFLTVARTLLLAFRNSFTWIPFRNFYI